MSDIVADQFRHTVYIYRVHISYVLRLHVLQDYNFIEITIASSRLLQQEFIKHYVLPVCGN